MSSILTLTFSAAEPNTIITLTAPHADATPIPLAVDGGTVSCPLNAGHNAIHFVAAGVAQLISYAVDGVVTDQPAIVTAAGYDLSIFVGPGGEATSPVATDPIVILPADPLPIDVPPAGPVKPAVPAVRVGGYNEWRLDDVSTSTTDYAPAIAEIESNIKKAGGGVLLGTAGRVYPILSSVRRHAIVSTWRGNGCTLDVGGLAAATDFGPGGAMIDFGNPATFVVTSGDAKWINGTLRFAAGGQGGWAVALPPGTTTVTLTADGAGRGNVGLFLYPGQGQQGALIDFAAGTQTVTFDNPGAVALKAYVTISVWNSTLKIVGVVATSSGTVAPFLPAITIHADDGPQYGHGLAVMEGVGVRGRRVPGVCGVYWGMIPPAGRDYSARGVMRGCTLAGLDIGMAFGDNAFCIDASNLDAWDCGTVLQMRGGNNQGERVVVRDSTLFNSGTIFDGTGGGGVWLTRNSLDYSDMMARNVTGKLYVSGWVELDYPPGPVVQVNGGDVVFAEDCFVQLTTGTPASVPPIAFGPNGGRVTLPGHVYNLLSAGEKLWSGEGDVRVRAMAAAVNAPVRGSAAMAVVVGSAP